MIYADNKTANQWVNEEKVSAANMWILQCYHYVREMGPTGEGMVEVKYVPTKRNVADLFTKGVPTETLKYLKPYMTGGTSLTALLKVIADEGGQSKSVGGQSPMGERPPKRGKGEDRGEARDEDTDREIDV